MSDDSPQKGWDTWFSGEPDSSGGEQQAPEQQVRPTAPPDSGSEPGSKPEAEPDGFEPESELERTNWTVPGLGDVLEGKASQDADSPRQVTQPRPESPIPEETPTQRQAPSADKPPARHSQPRNPAQIPAESPTPPSTPASPSTSASASVSAPESATPSTPASTSVLRSAPTPAPAPAATPTPAPTSQGTWQPQPAQAPAKPEPQSQIPNPAAGPAPNPWSADAQPTALVPKQSPPPQQPQAQPQTQPQSSSDQPTQVWTAAPAAQQQSPQSSAQAQTQLQAQVPAANPWAVDAQPTAQVPQQSQPPQSQPPQSQPPQNPYSGATAWQQAPQSPTPPPAAQSLPQGYGTPPQSPPPPGSGYEQQASWNQPEPSRPAASGASAASGAGGLRQQLSRKKILVSSGIGAAAIVVLATVLVMNQGSLTGSAHPLASPTPSGFQPTGTSVTADAEQTANAFLAAWQNGNFKQAASYTDDSSAAASTLASYASGLSLNGLQLTATGSTAVAAAPSDAASDSSGAAGSGASSSSSAAPAVPSSTAGVVTFNVVAKVGLPAATSTSSASASASASASSSSSSTASAASSVTANWSYSSKLTAYKKNGGWWIQWAPALVAPNLTAGEKVVSTAITPSAAEVEDANGGDLSSATDPGVHNIYLALKSKAPSGEGTPGVQIELESADGTPITSSADVLAQPVDTGVVKTTITPNIEAAAQQAVLKYPSSSMVVIQPTTGNILAVANNDGGNDFALTARVAPGSTDKILTSTALLANGLVSSPSQQVACPKTVTVNGTVFNNSEGESEPASTPFLDDFAISCNNAFGSWYTTIGSTTLATTAQKYYGLNEPWDIGTGASSTYYEIPSSASNGELFQELFGQGQLETAPLAMASMAATVANGSFKQPVVVQGASQVSATPLPSNVQQDLWQMMKAVVTQSNGTAYGVFNGVNSTVYGKTGTADVGTSQDKPNSWMVVFDPTLDIAIGCVVLDAGYGASFAGPEAAATLQAIQ